MTKRQSHPLSQADNQTASGKTATSATAEPTSRPAGESEFEKDLATTRAGHAPVLALRRDWDGSMDDVVVKDVETFRAEQMSEGSLWMACYFRNGERVTFHIAAKRKNMLVYDVGEMPEAWIDWDDRAAGVKSGDDTNRSQAAIDAAHRA